MTTLPLSDLSILPGSPGPMGAVFDGGGVNFAVFSEHASQIYLCLFDENGQGEMRLALPERTGPVWHGFVPGLAPGALYGLRADGPYAPQDGHRFNVNKLLIDPYARGFRGDFSHAPSTHGHCLKDPSADLSFDPADSAGDMPKCVVHAPFSELPRLAPDQRPAQRRVIYEAHVKSATQRHPGVPDELRGTYEGLAAPAFVEHLKRLGITTLELLPIHEIQDEGALVARGLRNHWGYNTVGFFAPAARYFGPRGTEGLRNSIETLHAAGIEVVLDVVFNHSAESDHLGQTLSFRGLDNASYYRLAPGEARYYVNDTGTGNTLDLTHPFVLRMVMDSLRYWVEAFGIDGFRFDLTTALAREAHGFDANAGFLRAVMQDPVLSDVILIAEPWDVGPGGYQLGQFPAPFAEWNDRFRDTARKFWRGDAGSAQDLASALLGSADLFDTTGRRASSSVNYAASHDGFTLADVTRYAQKHNHANGEGNRDGHHANYSDNFGVEGASDDPSVLQARARRHRNLLATVFLSQGTPMLLAGDEAGHSQQGNNNAYAQDNEITWIDWSRQDADLVAFTEAVSAFRRQHPVVRQTRFLHGCQRASDGLADVEWRSVDGGPVDWHDRSLSSFALLLRGNGETPSGNALADTVLLAFNRSGAELTLTLPDPGEKAWVLCISTDRSRQGTDSVDGAELSLPPHTVIALSLEARS